MNRLWVRISCAIGGVLLVAMLVLWVLPVAVIDLGLRSRHPVLILEFPGRLPAALADYYSAHHGWEGVDAVFAGAQAVARGRGDRPIGFYLIGPAGQVIHSDLPGVAPASSSQDPGTSAIPIEVNGLTVARLDLAPTDVGDDQHTDLERSVLGRLTSILGTIAVVVGVVGIPLGVWVSRSLTAPLNRLADGARAVGAGDLSRRVEVTGSSEVREMAQAFNDMAAALQAAELQRRNLMADVAHELRTPLSVVQGNLRAILDDVYPLDKVEVTQLYDQTRLLSRLVDDLRQLALAESGQLDLDLEPTDVSQLAGTAVSALSAVAENKEVKLVMQSATPLPPVEADGARLTQVLHNLLVNAINHTPPGGEVSVRVGCRPAISGQPAAVWLAVQDTGEGIPAEHLSQVFERFHRVDPARSRASGGAGLGLAIARAIVQSHGGEIAVASDGVPGRGSTFTIYLPVRPT